MLYILCALCVAALGIALVAQYAFDMRPCPWCVLQRGIYLLMALVFALAELVRSPAVKRVPVAVALLLAVAGMVSALYQHLVAAQQFSCNLTLADKIITALKLDTTLPAVFSATASCAEAAVSVLGIPFAYWSLGLFTVLALGSAWVLKRCR